MHTMTSLVLGTIKRTKGSRGRAGTGTAVDPGLKAGSPGRSEVERKRTKNSLYCQVPKVRFSLLFPQQSLPELKGSESRAAEGQIRDSRTGVELSSSCDGKPVQDFRQETTYPICIL